MVFRIRIFSSFCSSENCKDVYERLCETAFLENYGKDKEIYFTNDNDFTHVIIMNTAMPNIPAHIPKNNVIGLAFEPFVYLGLTNNFVNYAKQYIGKYFIGDKKNLPDPFVEGISYMWHNTPLKQIPLKTKIMSIMVSDKKHLEGHKYRHELVKCILKTQLPIDIYGRGCKYYNFHHLHDSRLKGEFNELEPYIDYQYHICIENMQSNHYFSEKIMNPLLTNTVPVYHGCFNIDEYFPDMVIKLSGKVEQDIVLLQEIVEGKHKKTINVEKVKNTINLIKNIDTLFEPIHV
jgi:hypothetical protein